MVASLSCPKKERNDVSTYYHSRLRFTIALFGAPFAGPLGRILVWTIHKRTKKKTSYWPHTPEEVDSLVAENRDTHEVYFRARAASKGQGPSLGQPS